MALLNRDQILTNTHLPSEIVSVPEWGGDICVVALTGLQRDMFEGSILNDDGTKNYQNLRARLVSLSVVDNEGKRLFGPSDVAELGQLSAAGLDRVFEVARRLSGLRGGDTEDAATVFSNGQSGDSIID